MDPSTTPTPVAGESTPVVPTTPAAPVVPAVGSETLLSGNTAPVSPPVTTTPSYILPDGKFAPGWLDSLPPELRTQAALQTMPSLQDLAQSYVETKRMVGKKLQAPSETSTPEEIANWRKTVGAPETPEGYGELRPQDFPEDQWDTATESQLKALAAKHHLPPAALQDIVGLHAGMVKGAMAEYEKNQAAYKEASVTTLRKEWGTDFDQKLHEAKTFAAMLNLDPATTMEFASPEFVLAMARGAQMVAGDKLVSGSTPTLSACLDAQITTIQNSPEYQGQLGMEKQQAAQTQLHGLLKAKTQK